MSPSSCRVRHPPGLSQQSITFSKAKRANAPHAHAEASFFGCENTSLILPNRLVRRFCLCVLAKRLETVSFPFVSLAFSPSSLALVLVPDSTDERVRECREESEGKRIFFSLVGVVPLPFTVAALVVEPFVAGFGGDAGVPIVLVAVASSSAGPTPSVAGLSSVVPFVVAGTCVEDISSEAGASGAGTMVVAAVALLSTIAISSGFVSETSATGAVAALVVGTGMGTTGATGTGSDGRTKVLAISSAGAEMGVGSGSGAAAGV